MDYNRDEIRKQYKDLFEYSLDLIYAIDFDGNFLDANDLTLITFGYEYKDFLKCSLADFLEEKDLKRAYRVSKELMKTGKQSKVDEYKLRTSNGEYIYVDFYAIPLKKDGKIYGLLGIGKNITERKKAEQNLLESEEKFKTIYKEGPIPVYIWRFIDGEFILIDYNNAAANFTENSVSNHLGYKATEIHKVRKDILNDLYQCFSQKTHIHRQMKYEFKSIDKKKFLSVNYSYVSPDIVLVHTEDITERLEAIEKLKDSEIKYRKMINNLDVGFYQVTLDGIMLNHNPAHNKILEYDINESLIGKKVTDFWQYPKLREAYVKDIMHNGFAKNYICQSLTKDGKKVVVQLNSHLIRDKEGNPIGIEGTFIDITEKFELEKKLKESERKFRILYENTPYSIALINSNGIIVDCNPTLEKMIGYDKTELIEKDFTKLPIITEKSMPIIIEAFQKFVKGVEVHRIDLQIKHKNGTLLWANLQASIIKIKNKTFIQAILTDIRARKEAESLIETELEKLKELDNLRKNLISRVSHELKTPLVSICGGSELLLDVYKNQFKKEPLEILELIEKGGKRLRFLVDNLIDISRVEYGKLKLKKENNNLSVVIKDVINELMYLIKDRKLNIHVSLPDNLVLSFDKIRLEQVIMNLLSNAIKNTPPSGNISIDLKTANNSAELSIKDTGIGLTKKEMDLLFTRFGKLERSGEGFEYIDIQGTGLGLYITKEIIDLHNGEIRAESPGRNKGSNFIVKLPLN
ncbi:MAG: PAS domain-containing sensor histidine kinase [Promethearchaeota archaeon]|nr:MAG: PAS domain-containing sensor histidine kinase [Candidatus Lokiarchaeota archaeon]